MDYPEKNNVRKKAKNSSGVRVSAFPLKHKKSAKGKKSKKKEGKPKETKTQESQLARFKARKRRLYLKRKVTRVRKRVMHLTKEPGAPLIALITVSGSSIQINGSDVLCNLLAKNANFLTALRIPEVPQEVKPSVIDLRNIDLRQDYSSVNILKCRHAYSMVSMKASGKRQLYNEPKPSFWPKDIPFVSQSEKGPDGKGRLLSSVQIREVLAAFQRHGLWRLRLGDTPVNFVETTTPAELQQLALTCYPTCDPADLEPPLTAIKLPSFEVKVENYSDQQVPAEPMDLEDQKNGVVDLKNIDISMDFETLNILHCRQNFSKIIQRAGCVKQKWNPKIKPTFWPPDVPFVSHSTKAADGKKRMLTGDMIRQVLSAFKEHCLKKIREGLTPVNYVPTTDLEQLAMLADAVPQSISDEENVEPPCKIIRMEDQEPEVQSLDPELQCALAQLLAAGGYQIVS